MDLESINFTAETLLVAIRRATRGRYRYVYQCADQGVKVDPAVEHQLTNHMTLLQDVAQAAGLDSDVVVAAMQAGSKAAHDER